MNWLRYWFKEGLKERLWEPIVKRKNRLRQAQIERDYWKGKLDESEKRLVDVEKVLLRARYPASDLSTSPNVNPGVFGVFSSNPGWVAELRRELDALLDAVPPPRSKAVGVVSDRLHVLLNQIVVEVGESYMYRDGQGRHRYGFMIPGKADWPSETLVNAIMVRRHG